ncbi:MAG: NAD(P)-dependent oxidoreductase [Firmicutes bacterium]|nr:NAD(P)-dependent oxidoreductase [Bacillota bacterium]
MKTIGFIGLGKMGLPMAMNLCRAGFTVYAHSGNPDSQAKLAALGGQPIGSFAEMASCCDVVITIVPADKEILELAGVIGEHGHDGLMWIDMTSAKGTTKKAIAGQLCRKAEETGRRISFMDAPVSGGVAGAEKGTLTIMVGSSREDFDAQQDVLGAMGKNIIYTGDVGAGSNIKMLNQMLNAANTAIAAEVLCISRQLGVEDTVLSQVVNQSSGGSYVFERNVPKFMMSGDHTPGFRLDLMKKDVGLFIDTAQEIDGFVPLANMVYQEYKASSHQGMGNLSYTAIHQWYEKNQKGE